MIRLSLLCVCLLFVGVSSQLTAADPTVPAAQHEFHGMLHGKQYWLRLKAPDPQFGKNRVAELVYTPDNEAAFGGAHVSDCPFLLLDEQARIVAWNGRDTGSKAIPAAPDGYAITREMTVGEGDEREIKLVDRKVPGALAWDRRVAPILLALMWTKDSSMTVPLLDFFGPHDVPASTLSWQDTAVTMAGVAYTITPDANGRLALLAGADGTVILTVAARK